LNLKQPGQKDMWLLLDLKAAETATRPTRWSVRIDFAWPHHRLRANRVGSDDPVQWVEALWERVIGWIEAFRNGRTVAAVSAFLMIASPSFRL
jgi:hypothetical protein